MHRFAWSAAALACLVALASTPLLVDTAPAAERITGESDWPQWRGPARDGHSPETGLLQNWKQQPPTLVWSVNGMGSGYASVSVADGRIYTTGNTDKGQEIIAVDANKGELLWSRPLTSTVPKHGYDGSRTTPTVDGDRLYAVTSDGEIVCVRAADGEIVWKKSFAKEWQGTMMSGWGFSESPLIDGDRVVCTPGGPDAMLVALNKLTGEEIWRAKVPPLGDKGGDGAGYASVGISEAGGVKQYVQLVGRGVIGVRAADGKFLWGYNKIANGTANIPDPIITGDYVFCSTGYQTGSALLKLTPEGDGIRADEVYFLNGKTLQNHHGGVLLVNDHIYMGHGHKNGFPVCVELSTGKIVWGGEMRGAGSGSAAVAYADGNLIFRYESGEVALIGATPKGYELKGVFTPDVVQSPSWAHPVVSHGHLFLREQDTLMCYRITR